MTEEEIRKIEKLTEAVRALDNTLSGIAWLKLTEMTEGSLEKVKKIRNDLQVCGDLWTDITKCFEKNVK
jgi:hypothetical protein